MRKYIFGTGVLTAIASGITLFRGLRDKEEFTWRAALGWLSWGITVALAIGTIIDIRRASRGMLAPTDSPVAGKEAKIAKAGTSR